MKARWLLLAALVAAAPAHAAHSRHHHPHAKAGGRAAHRAAAPRQGGPVRLASNSVMVVNQATGEVLYSKNPAIQEPIASITKLMTAMVTLDSGAPLDELLTITNEDVDHLRHSGSRLIVGATLTRREMLQLALMASENRAASVLARSYPGGLPAFAAAANRKARELRMFNTHFEEGTGLSAHNVSTAEDLVKMVNAATKYPLIHQITTTAAWHVNLPRHGGLDYHNTDMLVRDPSWHIGVSKTGYITDAGHCLVMQATIKGQPIIMVLLNSWGNYTRIADAVRVRRWLEDGALKG